MASRSLTEEQFIAMQTEVKEVVEGGDGVRGEQPFPDVFELYTDVMNNPMKNMSPSGEYTHGEKNPLL